MGKKHILLVDDDRFIREHVENAFEKVGYNVFSATEGEEALEILNQHHIYVVIIDLCLPDMNGFELCRRIKTSRPLTTIIAITGYASVYELTMCRETGFDDYFPKPVNLEILFKAIQGAFEKMDRWLHSRVYRSMIHFE